jgi:hypothetical protein
MTASMLEFVSDRREQFSMVRFLMRYTEVSGFRLTPLAEVAERQTR